VGGSARTAAGTAAVNNEAAAAAAEISAGAAAAATTASGIKQDPGALDKAVDMCRSVIHAETRATHAAAVTLVQAGRTAAVADRYVRRHPWSSVLVAAGTAIIVTTMAGRNGGSR
jgi:membrane protein